MRTFFVSHFTMKRVARFHFWLLFFSFFAYLALGFTLGPGFFKSDFVSRFHALADDIIVITATVLGPPAKPIVTATPICVSGASQVLLDWADDAATDTWDIQRDSLSLTTGLIASTYTDVTVTGLTTYTYEVMANGPMAPGLAVSDTVSVTTLDCTIVIQPMVTIQTLGGINVSNNRANIVISRRRPMITGVTTIPHATISILLTHPTMQALTTANVNGYFSWVPPLRLKTGTYILSVTATDPHDSSRTATDSLTFRIKEDDDGGAQDKLTVIPPSDFTFDFSVQVENVDNILYQGTDLVLSLRSLAGSFPRGSALHFFILDEKGNEVLKFPSLRVDTQGENELKIVREIPLAFSPGIYRVRVDLEYGRALVSREARVIVRALPLVDLGAGKVITYPEVARFVGTIFYSLFFLFLFYLILFFREYLLSLRALRHITEYHLARRGFISKKRKGVKL